jgi:DNA-binding response OmpR family regulator
MNAPSRGLSGNSLAVHLRSVAVRRPILQFVPGPGTLKGETRLLLFINGKHVDAPATNTKLLACLHQHMGKVFTFHRLCRLLGFPNMTDAELHMLRQYITWMRQVLDEHGMPYRLAVDRSVGYALCEMAWKRG